MRGLLADVNFDGHLRNIISVFRRPDWKAFWEDLNLREMYLDETPFDRTVADDVLWRYCQDQQLLLLTCNRNHDGSDSLDAVIEREIELAVLPVFTVGSMYRISKDWAYIEQVAIDLLDYLIQLQVSPIRSASVGRIFLPKQATRDF